MVVLNIGDNAVNIWQEITNYHMDIIYVIYYSIENSNHC